MTAMAERRGVWAVVAVLLACTPEPVAQVGDAAAPVTPVVASPARIVAPATFERDPAVSENTVSDVEQQLTKPLCRALKAGETFAVGQSFVPGATGRCGGGWKAAPGNPMVQVRRASAGDAACDPTAAVAGLIDELVVVERCKLGVVGFKLEAPAKTRAVATLLLELVGRSGERRVLRSGEITVALEKGERWRAAAIEFGELEEASGTPRFHDVSGQVGVGLHRAAVTQTVLTYHGDSMRLETTGGLAVIDLDGDGDDDLLAWNRLRTSQAFFNDGAGGFRRIHDLIPKREVGSFLLTADLDGDGTLELVSSEIASCADGKARFGLYSRVGKTFAARPGPEFEHACRRRSMVVFEHIAVADIDRDGRLDLFFSGYRGPDSKQALTHNMFQADDGLPNLLFRQTAPLVFEAEVLSKHAFSYAATFFDVDADGDDDLFVANDYGVNELWRNDANGRLTPVRDHPLTANGQSMGVTVGDFDGDLDLDVYVSNMFSKAGNRVVPLAAGTVSDATYAELMLLARGNTLFRSDGPDRYGEVAADFGMTRAGWAWGQAWFDVDNDGAREMYVVNGMTSHSDPRAPDF